MRFTPIRIGKQQQPHLTSSSRERKKERYTPGPDPKSFFSKNIHRDTHRKHMVKFGKQLLYHQVDGWSESYIDYKTLKKVAKIGVYDARDGSVLFFEATKKEVDKVEKFYIDRLRDFEEQYNIIRSWKAPADAGVRPRAPTTPGRLRVLSTGSSGDEEDETESSNLSQRASLERAVVDLWRHIQFLTNFCTSTNVKYTHSNSHTLDFE